MKISQGILFFLFFITAGLQAHEVRPAYLELKEDRAGEFRVLWKVPMRGDLRLSLQPEFSGHTQIAKPVSSVFKGGAVVETWRIQAIEPLRGQTLKIRGLDATATDALVRMEFEDGQTWIKRLTPRDPEAIIPRLQNTWSVAAEYSKLGVEHILTGCDHLLFVFALLLLVKGLLGLAKTITAFTVAHTVTLSLSTLGFVHVPPPPVEVLIALSIAFVAREIFMNQAGVAGLAQRQPWLVSFAFGLLHGLGFAGGLSEAGLPAGHIPQALLFFSAGVEAGHLFFVAVALTGIDGIRRLKLNFPAWTRTVPAYGIGSIAMFWVVQRVAAF